MEVKSSTLGSAGRAKWGRWGRSGNLVFCLWTGSRIIYTRFHTKSAVLLHRIKNQNIEAEIQKLMVETLGPLQGKQEVSKDHSVRCMHAVV